MVKLNLPNRKELGSLGEMDSLSRIVKTFIRNLRGFELREIQLKLISFSYQLCLNQGGMINVWLSLTFAVMITSVFTKAK